MRIAKKLIVVSVVAIAAARPATAHDEISSQSILAISKMAGACGILNSMIQFQTNTKMSNGDAFVSRFWEVESARLGLTVRELSDKCNSSVAAYDKFWSATEAGQ